MGAAHDLWSTFRLHIVSLSFQFVSLIRRRLGWVGGNFDMKCPDVCVRNFEGTIKDRARRAA